MSQQQQSQSESPQTFSNSRDVGGAFQKCPQQTIKARWSKPEVTPNHNINTTWKKDWRSKRAPYDLIPEEALVECIVETTNVPDGTQATITLYHCATDAPVPGGVIKGLKVAKNMVVTPPPYTRSRKLPLWYFEAQHLPYDPWDKPLFYFKVVLENGLEATTPKDSEKNPSEVLRVLYWDVVMFDASCAKGFGMISGGALGSIWFLSMAIRKLLTGMPHRKVFYHGAHMGPDPDPKQIPNHSISLFSQMYDTPEKLENAFIRIQGPADTPSPSEPKDYYKMAEDARKMQEFENEKIDKMLRDMLGTWQPTDGRDDTAVMNKCKWPDAEFSDKDWGSIVRNSYLLFFAGHGPFMIHGLGTNYGWNPKLKAINNLSDTPSMPRWLVFISACLAGSCEPACNALLKRGTHAVWAYKHSLYEHWGAWYAVKFFKRWKETNLDPNKILPLFLEITAHGGQAEPRLFGAGAGLTTSPPFDNLKDILDRPSWVPTPEN